MMGEREITVENGRTCTSCNDFLEAGEKVHTYYGNVSGVMPGNGEPFGLPVICSSCSNLNNLQKKKNQKENYTPCLSGG